MSSELQELMASNDPMATPIMSVGPPPAMPTHPSNDGMQQQPVSPLMQPPITTADTKKKVQFINSPEVKDAFLVALVVFLVLMPSVQTALINQFSLLEDKTMLGLASSSLAGAGFFFAKQYLDQM